MEYSTRTSHVDPDRIKDQWHELRSKIMQRWHKLTMEDLTYPLGNAHYLAEILRLRYELELDEAKL